VRSSAPQRAKSALGPAPRDALLRESALLTFARAALRAGELDACARRLSRLRAEFAQGVLSQEREVLEIELLHARGQTGAASTQARRFIAAHPESPHSEKLARFVQ
jgi:outer membrane protein assembly factor BamD (BamD/ComL family)